jgi:histidyl-tRNA synthetase
MTKPSLPKGTRDFLPSQVLKRKYMFGILESVFQRHGFVPIETPSLELMQTLTGKYGEEGDKLMYRFEDNGQRRVALRYDQTVPLSRVAAQYANALPSPFKRYQIQNVWRAENTQRGRYREFLQCDIDIVGVNSYIADSEIIYVAISCLTTLGFKNFRVLVNDRKVFEGLDSKAILIIDKLKKIGEEGVKEELRNNGFDENILDQIKNAKPTENLEKILGSQKEYVVFEPTLARGLSQSRNLRFKSSIFPEKNTTLS